LLLVPLVDAALLVFVAGEIGGPATILLVVLTALIGTLLLRAEGRRTIGKITRKLQSGSAPTDELIDGGLLIASGAFLITPGLVTDLIGFLLVLPITRLPIRIALKKFVIVPYMDERTGGFTTGSVYTFGFPDPEESGQVDPGAFDLGGPGRSDSGAGGGPGHGHGPDSDATSTAGGRSEERASTIDLDADEYDVVDDEDEST
jgi:UPF0716 protein FxsA